MGQIIMKRQKGNEGENYINAFPKLKKWINECSYCHNKGYDPNMPSKITIEKASLAVFHIKKYFKPLYVNENGLCEVCQRLVNPEKP